MAQCIGEDFTPFPYTNGTCKKAFIREHALKNNDREFSDDAFMVVDVGDVVKKHSDWVRELPRVKPFFAVKCMPYTPLLSVLASLGAGFDCASLEEIDRVLSLGVHPSQIVYSHTRKQRSFLSYAAENDVDQMTFDDLTELRKIKAIHPSAKLLLRLSIFDRTAKSPFGFKYGCHHKNVKPLLQDAKKLGMNVVGVHFHIGSGSDNPFLFETALQFSKKVFDIGKRLGFNMNVVDIGGGFPGSHRSAHPFSQFAYSIRDGIDAYFPESSGVTIIAEPGRFYVESAATLVTNVIGIKAGRKRDSRRSSTASSVMRKLFKKPALERQSSTVQRRLNRKESISHFAEMTNLPSFDKPLNYDYMYFVNDGLFTSFLRNLFGFSLVAPQPLKEVNEDDELHLCMIMGQTCPEEDVIIDEIWLPELKMEDWIIFEDMGAYTCMATGFNGFSKNHFYYAVPENLWSYMKPLFSRCTQGADSRRFSRSNNNKDENVCDTTDGGSVTTRYMLRDVYKLNDI